MMKSYKREYVIQVVLGIWAVLTIFGCAAPEIEQYETVYPGQEHGPRIARVSRIFTEDLVGKMRITIEADSDLTDKYTAFKLTDPLRLILDLPNVRTTQVSEAMFEQKFPLMRITPFQFQEGEIVNSRIEVALSRLVPYLIFNDSNKLFIDLEVPVDETVPTPVSAASLPPGFEELTPIEPHMPPSQTGTGTSLFSDSAIQLAPAIAIPSIQIESPPSQTGTGTSLFSDSAIQPAPAVAIPSIQIEPPPKMVGGVTPLPGGVVAFIKDVHVSEVNGKTRIVVYTDRTPEFAIKKTQQGRLLTLDLKQSELPPGGEKVIKPDAVATTVKHVRAFQLRRSPDGTDNVVRIRVNLMKPSQHAISTEAGKIIMDIEHPAVFAQSEMVDEEDIAEIPLLTGVESALKGKEDELAETEVAEEPTIRAPKTGEEREYKGQLISLHFQEADILDVLQVIAEVSDLNLVVHPGVGGTVTVHLTNIPWDQALDIVLKMNDLSVEIDGNILRVASAGIFQAEIDQRIQQQQRQLEARSVQEALQPLETKLITINFAEPGTIVGIITTYFEGPNAGDTERRGTITVDSRTKTLIIQDTEENIKKIEEIVAILDRRTPQIMIEARIVSINTGVRKELGINWTGQFFANPQHGNALDYRFPYSVEMPGFGVNLPGLSGDTIGTTGTMTFGSIDDVLTLFAQIDAAEEEYKAKTLGQPKIFTQDNIAASVTAEQTRVIAGSATVSSDGTITTTSEEVSVQLSLNVTPRISSDGYVTMVVNVTNGSFVNPVGAATQEQSVNSQLTVKDGETAVIGGVYSTSESESFVGVPYLHRIPLIGHLFKSTLPNSQDRSELLVFLTPHILDRRTLKPQQESTDVSYSY